MSGSVVILAYYFPPLVGIASERAGATARHLASLGWDPTVITATDGFYHRRDSPQQATPTYRVVRTRSIELSRLLRHGYAAATGSSLGEGSLAPLEAGHTGNVARSLVRDFVYVPDAQVGWIPFAAAAAARSLGEASAPRVVLSSSVPFSAHLAAMRAARKQRAGWVAEFRDPWATSESPWRSSRPARRRVDASLERRVLLAADHVIVTSESFRDQLIGTYSGLGAEDVSVITNGFEEMPTGEPPEPGEPLSVLYAGTVSAGEDVAPVVAAFTEFEKRAPGAAILRVLGPDTAWRRAVGDRDVPRWLRLDGTVTPEQARGAMASSSALLLVNCHPAYRGILPGKAFEYLGARRPLLAAIPGESEMARLISRYGDARIAGCARTDEFVAALEVLVSEHREGSLQRPRVDAALVAPISRREQAKRLADVLARFAR